MNKVGAFTIVKGMEVVWAEISLNQYEELFSRYERMAYLMETEELGERVRSLKIGLSYKNDLVLLVRSDNGVYYTGHIIESPGKCRPAPHLHDWNVLGNAMSCRICGEIAHTNNPGILSLDEELRQCEEKSASRRDENCKLRQQLSEALVQIKELKNGKS